MLGVPNTPIPPLPTTQKLSEGQRTAIGCGLLVLLLALVVFLCAQVPTLGANMVNAASTDNAGTEIAQTASVPTAAPETLEQRIRRIVNDTHILSVTTEDSPAGLAVDVSIKDHGLYLSKKGAFSSMQEEVFEVQRRLWTSNLHLYAVEIEIHGDATDAYGNAKTVLFGTAELDHTTASKFSWDNLTAASAWAVYDKVTLGDYFG